jgi:non-canonical (house-cleaning) NTP pyrophosphatase
VVFATSPIWEVPEKVRKELILGRDLSEAGEAAGVLKEASEGHRTGIIDVLSRGYYNRENYLASAVFLALLSFFQEDVIT